MHPPVPATKYEESLIDWIQSAIQEGEQVLKAEPMYDEIDKAIQYIMGDQTDMKRPTNLSNIYDNRTKHILMQQVAFLTDVNPLFGFATHNDRFQDQGEILNNLTAAWWQQSFADLQLGTCLQYAAGPGTGYIEVVWDAAAGGGVGDIMLLPRDPRDVIPIRPTLDGNVQNWEGVIIRTAQTVSHLKTRFPEKAHRITPSRHGAIPDRSWGAGRAHHRNILSPAQAHMNRTPRNMSAVVPSTNLYYIYMKDPRLHTGSSPLQMGDPKASWSYQVQPAGSKKADGSYYDSDDYKIYPRGRLIICTDDCILYDGPNPYWHGQFPICQLRLDPWPWSLLGLGITRDLMPLQDALNETANGILDMVRKALRPGVKGDARAMPESMWNRLDTRLPGTKIRHNPILGNIDYEPPPNIPPYVYDFLRFMVEEMDYHGGVPNMEALTQLKQAPGADSIEAMKEALSPTLRRKGRLMEFFLRQVGEMVKVNFFQFYTLPRRMQILGERGIDMEDFQFDPGTLVPAYSKAADGEMYDPHYDIQIPRHKRAKHHHKQFTFQITPNSLLELNQLSRKMMYLRLHREGLMDPWTLLEVLEIPNGGQPPSGTKNIPQRMQEAAMMGIGQPIPTPGPQPTGQVAPHLESKPDADGIPRPVVSESE